MTSGPRAGASPGKPRGETARPLPVAPPHPQLAPPPHSLTGVSQHRAMVPPEEPHSGQGFLQQSLSSHTHFLSSSAYLGTPGWLGDEGDGQGRGRGRRTAKSPRSPREGGKTSWGQIRKLRWRRHRGGLWLVDVEKASYKRHEVLSESVWGHSTKQWLWGRAGCQVP